MGNKIIFEGKSKNNVRTHELYAIILLLDFFNADITCIDVGVAKTPDLRINGIEWELKSPRGDNPNTLENILRKAEKQSTNIILDLTRIKMNNEQAIRRTKHYLSTFRHKHKIKRLLVITKGHRIIDFKDEL